RGFAVDTAASLSEALTQFSPPPCCVVLDLVLPDGPGEVILRRVRAHKLPSRVTVCTGINDSDRLDAVRRLNPEALLVKPIDVDDVVKLCEGRGDGEPRTEIRACGFGGVPTKVGFERVPFSARVTVSFLRDDPVIEARSVDISRRCVSLVCSTPLP